MTDQRSPIADEVLAEAVAVRIERDHLRRLVSHLRGTDCDEPHCPLRWAIWHHRAERLGTRLALAERALRLTLAGKPAATEIAAWRDELKEQEHG